jgi:hypothetical protein
VLRLLTVGAVVGWACEGCWRSRRKERRRYGAAAIVIDPGLGIDLGAISPNGICGTPFCLRREFAPSRLDAPLPPSDPASTIYFR